MERKIIFISYSWDSEEHINWVSKVAEDLEEIPEFHVIWDGYDLDSLTDKNLYMEESVRNSDFTVVIATENYCQKANNRTNGVGIETYLNTEKHWRSLQEKNKTNTIVVLRDKNSTPTYLAGHFHIDFTNEEDYPKKISELKRNLLEKPRFNRPKKHLSANEKKAYQLTKAAEIIGIGARNRSCIISAQEATDFSGSNRIKFELWETKTPTLVHILALHNNINISQTLSRAAEIISNKKIPIKNLTVLRPKEKRKNTDSIDKLLSEKNPKLSSSINLTELTYDEYVWNYCIDESFKKVEPPDAIDFYTTQELKNNEKTYESGAAHLISELTNDSSCSPQLIIGSGGIGKTSLCLYIAEKLIKQHSEDVLTILIRSEDIRKHIESTSATPPEVETIYDIYTIQAKYLKHNNIFDKKTFDLSIVSGNIVIIIDGLDELASIFKERFNLRLLLESISSLHTELGYGRILLTTRDTSIINRSEIERLDFKSYELLGFKEENCVKYLKKRFAAHEDNSEICTKIIKKVNSSLFQAESRIIPFFIDIIANIFEESLENCNTQIDLELNISPTPYPSLNEITDHIILSIFEREKTRHKTSIEPTDYIELFTFLNQEYGESWEFKEIEEVANSLYGENGRELSGLIKKHPLLKTSEDSTKFKYDFLHSYFNSILLFNGLTNAEIGLSFAKSLSKPTIESTETRDIIKFFNEKNSVFFESAKKMVKNYQKQLKSQLSTIEKHIYIQAIEKIITLASLIKNSKKEEFTKDIKEIYEYGEEKVIDGLYINGDLPSLDFTGLTIINSRFKHYQKFLSSDFEDSKFIYTEFTGCHNEVYKKSSLLKADIDKTTCSIGDLAESIAMLSQESDINESLLSCEAEKFLSSFYRNSGFRDNNKTHITFSNHVTGLRPKHFHKLVSSEYINIKTEKEIDTFYEISDNFKSSVRRFINDGYKDSKMKKFLQFIASR